MAMVRSDLNICGIEENLAALAKEAVYEQPTDLLVAHGVDGFYLFSVMRDGSVWHQRTDTVGGLEN